MNMVVVYTLRMEKKKVLKLDIIRHRNYSTIYIKTNDSESSRECVISDFRAIKKMYDQYNLSKDQKICIKNQLNSQAFNTILADFIGVTCSDMIRNGCDPSISDLIKEAKKRIRCYFPGPLYQIPSKAFPYGFIDYENGESGWWFCKAYLSKKLRQKS